MASIQNAFLRLLFFFLSLVHLVQTKETTITLAAGFYHTITSISAEHTTAMTTTPLLTTTHGPTPIITLAPPRIAIPTSSGNQFRDWVQHKCRKMQ
ncbi:hypothetical protein IFR05_008802 [Cadophora sp. M221]|nr:hypothetical protein IFR05_008802 [Cadophora sp. M221]